jgi:carotenoid cleavage dioxygenase
MQQFPDDYFLRGNFAPWPMEGEIADLVVDGELPSDLDGALVRIGPNPQFPPIERPDWFSGDGMVHAVRLQSGRARYRNRWVRTRRFEMERNAGRALFGGLTSVAATDPDALAALMREVGEANAMLAALNTANTNVVLHAGRLLALAESSPPTVLDPATLATHGTDDFAGRLVGPMTAHPWPDPRTGELLFFGYSPYPPHLLYYVAGADGRVHTSIEISVPWPAMMHDAVATEQDVVFGCFPATLRAEHLPHRIPFGFHGQWLPAAALEAA